MPLGQNSLQSAGLNINPVLSNISQGVRQPEFVMRLLFPIAWTADYQGQIIQFGDQVYEEVDDDRADDTPYAEVLDGYTGRPFSLNTKGFSYRLGDKKKKRMENLKINWGARAQNRMMKTAGLKHEIECARIATDPVAYGTNNRIALSPGSQFNTIDPGPFLRAGKSQVSSQCGEDPNVMVLGRDVFDALCENPFIRDKMKYTGRDSVTTDILASMYGFDRVAVCNAIVKNSANQRVRVFGKHVVMGRTNPAALDQKILPYRPNQMVDSEEPSYGYTYALQNNPVAYDPYYDPERAATVYKLDFDRAVVSTGLDEATSKITYGYLISNAAA
jgi:hypothetical protein